MLVIFLRCIILFVIILKINGIHKITKKKSLDKYIIIIIIIGFVLMKCGIAVLIGDFVKNSGFGKASGMTGVTVNWWQRGNQRGGLVVGWGPKKGQNWNFRIRVESF